MNAQENNALARISEQLGELKTKTHAVMEEQQRASNKRGEMYDEIHTIKRNIDKLNTHVDKLTTDVAEMKPVIAKGKRMLLIFVGLVFGAGFTAGGGLGWMLKILPLIP